MTKWHLFPMLIMATSCTVDLKEEIVEEPLNAAPSIESMAISPLESGTSAVLSCDVQATDSDNDTLEFTYLWKNIEGRDLSSEQTLPLNPSNFQPEDIIRCLATVSDGILSISDTAEITLANTAPTIADLRIESTDNLALEETIACKATISDPDLDPALVITQQWFHNGQAISTEQELTLARENFAVYDAIACTITVSDSHGGLSSGTVDAVVGNTPPTLSGAQITPSSPTSQDTLTCQALDVADAQNDSVTFSYSWTIDGTPQPENSDSLEGPFLVGSTITCEVAPHDGVETGDSATATTSIENTAPIVNGVTLNTPTLTDDILTATVDSEDPDSEQSLSVNYEWHVYYTNAGNLDLMVQNGSSPTLDGSTYFDKGDSVYVLVTVNDGLIESDPSTSIPIVIANAPPSDLTVSLSPTPGPYNDAVWTCQASANDQDPNDALSYSYLWSTGHSGPQLSLNGEVGVGESLGCTATVTDGQANASATANAVMENRLPWIDTVEITPESPTMDTPQLSCNVNATDPDGETLTVNRAWLVDGALTYGQGSTLNGPFQIGQEIICLAEPMDSTGVGQIVSGTTTIENSRPSIDSIGLTPIAPTTNETILATAVVSDLDNDHNPTVNYEWHVIDASAGNVDSIVQSGVEIELDGAIHFDKGDSVYVIATANDGLEDSLPAISNSVQIENLPPINLQVSIDAVPGAYNDATWICSASADDDDSTDSLQYSYLWSTGDTGPQLSVNGNLSVGETISCTATVTDGTDSLSSEASTIIMNRLPSIDAILISPTNPTAATPELICDANASDPDGEMTTLSYEWTIDGSVSPEQGPVLDGPFLVGQSIGCTVTPMDSTGSGSPESVATSIENHLPMVSSVTLSPSPALTNEAIVATAVLNDIDGPQNPTAYYEWHVIDASAGNQDLVVQTGNDNRLEGLQHFDKGDSVYVVVWANDGMDDGMPTSSGNVDIENTIPSNLSVSISAAPGPYNDAVWTCSATATDEDPSDTLQYSYLWSTGDIGDQISLSNQVNVGEAISCTATVSDGQETQSDQASAIIANRLPWIDSVFISPNAPTEATTQLHCEAIADDDDNETPTLSYEWMIDGVVSSEESDLLNGPFTVGQTISCSVTPADSMDQGVGASAATSIDNTAPTVDYISLSHNTLQTDDLLIATAMISDSDSSQVPTPIYEWHVYYASIGNADLMVQRGPDNTLDGTQYFDKGDSVYVVVTADDGVEESLSLASPPITVENSPPEITAVTIDAPNGFYNDATLSCSHTVIDADGDALNSITTWSLGDTGNTLLLDGSLSPGTPIDCTVTVTDGVDSVDQIDTATLLNRDPIINSILLSPNTPTAATTEIACMVNASDDDGETPNLTYTWMVDGASIAEPTNILSGPFAAGQTIHCEATATDAMNGIDSDNASISIGNTPPTIDSIDLTAGNLYTNDTIHATALLSDIDSAQSLTANYEWHVIDASDSGIDKIIPVNDASLSGADPEQHFGRDDQVYVIVTPNDGYEDGPSVTSNTVSIFNSPPTAPSLSLEGSGNPPTSFVDDLICSIDTPAIDPDPEDSVLYHFDWVRSNGDIAQSLTDTTDTEDTLPSALLSGGDWTCEATPTDGTEDGPMASETISVEYNTNMARRTELLECVVETGGCDVILTPFNNPSSPYHNYIIPSPGTPIGTTYAGQTVCIPNGTYSGINLKGMQGTANAPILITNCGQGQVFVDGGGTGAVDIDDGQYLKLSGTGDPDQLYGFVISNAGSGRASLRFKGDDTGVTDIEVEYFEIMGPAYTGITVSNYPYCNAALDRSAFTQANTLIHHNYIHDIVNENGENGGEGLYIGTSHYHMSESPTSSNCAQPYQGPSLRGVQVYENLIEDTGRDGIQVGAAVEGMAIHHNTVRRYALAGDFGHVGGIQVNPGSVGLVYSNYIESDPNTTSETAIQFSGGEDGPSYIYNNIVSGASVSLAFITRMGNASSPVHVHNNTFVNRYELPTEGVSSTGTYTLYLGCNFDGSGTIQDFNITNNIFTNYGSVGSYIYGTVGNHYSKYFSDDGCLINGNTYGNSLDQDLILDDNLYVQDIVQVGFMDYAAGDYHLDVGSSAIDAGDDLSTIFTEDFDGVDRGTGVPFDMGAFHYD